MGRSSNRTPCMAAADSPPSRLSTTTPIGDGRLGPPTPGVACGKDKGEKEGVGRLVVQMGGSGGQCKLAREGGGAGGPCAG